MNPIILDCILAVLFGVAVICLVLYWTYRKLGRL